MLPAYVMLNRTEFAGGLRQALVLYKYAYSRPVLPEGAEERRKSAFVPKKRRHSGLDNKFAVGHLAEAFRCLTVVVHFGSCQPSRVGSDPSQHG